MRVNSEVEEHRSSSMSLCRKFPPIKLKMLYFMLTITLALGISTSPSFAAEKLMAIDDTGSVWIVGTDVNGYGCWSLPSAKFIPTLQVKVRGKWVTKAKAKLSKKSTLCADKNYPWVATYHWIVDELGATPHGGNLARDIVAREYLPKSGNSNAFAGTPFVKQIYRNEEDLMSDYSSVIYEALDGISENSGFGTSSSSKFPGCTFKGKKLYGKIQIVDFLPDIKVQIVDFLPDLKVQKVEFLPTSCGKWQFVNFLPDLKVQFVDVLPDIKVQFVDFLPGMP